MISFIRLALAGTIVVIAAGTGAQELIVGETRIEPGVVLVVEGAIKGDVRPRSRHLANSPTDVHLEFRANWDYDDLPAGTPPGGFIPYLTITGRIRNQRTGETLSVSLLPHINLVDNFHYARNIALPGARDDLYQLEFQVSPPTEEVLATHLDWRNAVGAKLFSEIRTIEFRDIDFEEIAQAER